MVRESNSQNWKYMV